MYVCLCLYECNSTSKTWTHSINVHMPAIETTSPQSIIKCTVPPKIIYPQLNSEKCFTEFICINCDFASTVISITLFLLVILFSEFLWGYFIFCGTALLLNRFGSGWFVGCYVNFYWMPFFIFYLLTNISQFLST